MNGQRWKVAIEGCISAVNDESEGFLGCAYTQLPESGSRVSMKANMFNLEVLSSLSLRFFF